MLRTEAVELRPSGLWGFKCQGSVVGQSSQRNPPGRSNGMFGLKGRVAFEERKDLPGGAADTKVGRPGARDLLD